MLNLDRLRALHAVSTHGSLNAAAEVLHVTTSAVSQQITKLEEEVGHPLIERRGRGVRLTDAATLLVAHAARALSVLNEAEAELDARRTTVTGQLTLAAFPTAARGLVPEALARLGIAHPQLRVVLTEMEPHLSVPRLERGDYDLVLAQDWMNSPRAIPPGLTKEPVLDDIADIALPRAHRLANRASVALADLAGEAWIASPGGTSCHDWLRHTLRTDGLEPNVTHTAAEFATQLALVAADRGVAVLPRLGREPVPATVRVIPVTPTLHRHVHALWRTDAARRTAIRATVTALQSAARALFAAKRPRREPSPVVRATRARPAGPRRASVRAKPAPPR